MSEVPRLERIVALRLVTHDAARLARFYAAALGAERAGEDEAITAEECRMLGVSGGARTPLRIGSFAIDLDRFYEPGRPYPPEADAADLRFQHFAVIVRNIGAVFERARAAGATLISRGGPVTLPASSGGVTAIKLRDPEGHPFELLQFPADADNGWRGVAPNAAGVLGVDHTAISVADAATSRAFYEAAGLAAGSNTLNYGSAQEALDDRKLASVDVVAMVPAYPIPHLELLGYHGTGKSKGSGSAAVDIAATRTVWSSDEAGLMRDPDGHWQQVTDGARRAMPTI